MFAFYLQSNDNDDGQLTIGGVNTNMYTGQLMWVPVSSDTYWEVNMPSMKLNGQSVTSVTNAIVDSGTSLIVGPKSDVASIASSVGATLVQDGEYSIDCNAKIPDITVTVGSGTKLTIQGEALKIKV